MASPYTRKLIMALLGILLVLIALVEVQANDLDPAPHHNSYELDHHDEVQSPIAEFLEKTIKICEESWLPLHVLKFEKCIREGFEECMEIHKESINDPKHAELGKCVAECFKLMLENPRGIPKCLVKCYEENIKITKPPSDHIMISLQNP